MKVMIIYQGKKQQQTEMLVVPETNLLLFDVVFRDFPTIVSCHSLLYSLHLINAAAIITLILAAIFKTDSDYVGVRNTKYPTFPAQGIIATIESVT
jgi:hypothetical protein